MPLARSVSVVVAIVWTRRVATVSVIAHVVCIRQWREIPPPPAMDAVVAGVRAILIMTTNTSGACNVGSISSIINNKTNSRIDSARSICKETVLSAIVKV